MDIDGDDCDDFVSQFSGEIVLDSDNESFDSLVTDSFVVLHGGF